MVESSDVWLLSNEVHILVGISIGISIGILVGILVGILMPRYLISEVGI